MGKGAVGSKVGSQVGSQQKPRYARATAEEIAARRGHGLLRRAGVSGTPKDKKFNPDEIPEWVQTLVGKLEVQLTKRNFKAALKLIRRKQSRFAARRKSKRLGAVDLADEDKLELPLASLGLSVRTLNNLAAEGVLKVRALAAMKPEEFLRIPNFGVLALWDCVRALEFLGIAGSLKLTEESKRKIPLAAIGLPAHVVKGLESARVLLVRHLEEMSQYRFFEIRGFTWNEMEECVRVLLALGVAPKHLSMREEGSDDGP